MKPNDLPSVAVAAPSCREDRRSDFAALLEAPLGAQPPIEGVITGELLGLADEGTMPLVRWPGQAMAQRARSVVDLHGAHIGASVLIAFERSDATQPIVLGVLRPLAGWPLPELAPAQVQADADGQRMVVNAREQLVLRCGKASITLTKAGKVLIEGAYVSSRSSGLQRLQGATIELN